MTVPAQGPTDTEAVDIARNFDLGTPPGDFVANPYPYYHALRGHSPIKRMRDGSLFLTRAADLEAVYRQPSIFSSDKRREFLPKFDETPIYEHHTTSLVFNDPPLHTMVRRILQGALAARSVAHMEHSLVELVDGLLDRAQEQGRIDLIEDFASAIPIEVIGNLLGVPREDRGPLRHWSLSILGALEPVVSAENLAEASRSVEDFLQYLEILVADRRAHLRDPEVDVLSRLIIGNRNGERLGHRELLQNCIFLLNAGHETTTNLIGNGLMALLAWPSERARLIADPELIPSAIDEFLRYESSNQLGNRRAMSATVIAGEAIEADTLLTLCIGAANRDPARFDEPGRLGSGSIGFDIGLTGIGFDVFELQLHLLEQASAALGAGPVLLAPQLGDLQLKVRDQRLRRALARQRIGQVSPGIVGTLERGNQQRLQRCEVLRQGRDRGFDDCDGITKRRPTEPENADRTKKIRGLPRTRRTPGMLRVAPVDPVQETGKLEAGQRWRTDTCARLDAAQPARESGHCP